MAFGGMLRERERDHFCNNWPQESLIFLGCHSSQRVFLGGRRKLEKRMPAVRVMKTMTAALPLSPGCA